jgi:hypothetical protein
VDSYVVVFFARSLPELDLEIINSRPRSPWPEPLKVTYLFSYKLLFLKAEEDESQFPLPRTEGNSSP